MKKLMMSLAVCALASAASAEITYKMTTGYNGGTLSADTMGYYSLYARAAADPGMTKEGFGSTRDEIVSYFTKALADGTWATAKEDWKNKTTDSNYRIGGGHVFDDKDMTQDNALTFNREGSAEMYNYWAVIFYDDGKTEGFRVIEAQNKTGNADITIAEGTGGSWGESWQAAPEPTSGLLMLLGFAGLALKRKRA